MYLISFICLFFQTQNLIKQNPENPFSEAQHFAPFISQAEQLLLTHWEMKTPSSVDRPLGKPTWTQLHTSTRVCLRGINKQSLNVVLRTGARAQDQAGFGFIPVLNVIPCSRKGAVNSYCSNAMVMSSKRNPSVWLGPGRFGWGRGETVGGIGRLISGGLSNRHSLCESSCLQHTHTISRLLALFLCLSLTHLVISWSEIFPWRTIAVEMDYDYKG